MGGRAIRRFDCEAAAEMLRDGLPLAGLAAALAAALAALPAGNGPVAATAAACADVRLPAADVRIAVEETREPPVDRSLDVVSLTRKARERSTVKTGAGRVVGLTTADFRFDFERLRFVTAPAQGGGVCVAPARLHLRLQANQTVYVVRSMRRDPCWDAAVLEHEMQHVGFNNEAIRATAAAARPDIEALVRRPVGASSVDAAAKAMGKAIEAIVEGAARDAFAEAARKHASIDTLRAYNQLRVRCGL